MLGLSSHASCTSLHCYTVQRWARARLSSVLRSCTASLSSHSSRHTSPCPALASPANHLLSFAHLINIMNQTKCLTFGGLEFLEVAARVRTDVTLPRPFCTPRLSRRQYISTQSYAVHYWNAISFTTYLQSKQAIFGLNLFSFSAMRRRGDMLVSLLFATMTIDVAGRKAPPLLRNASPSSPLPQVHASRTNASPVQHTFYCVFCPGLTGLPVGQLDQYRHHMLTVHTVHQEFDILLAINFLGWKEKQNIVEQVKQKKVTETFFEQQKKTRRKKAFWKSAPKFSLRKNLNVQTTILLDDSNVLSESESDKLLLSDSFEQDTYFGNIKHTNTILRKPNQINTELTELERESEELLSDSFEQETKCDLFIKKVLNNASAGREERKRCKNCDLIFSTQKQIDFHVCNNPRNKRNKYQCRRCDRSYEILALYKNHINRKSECSKPAHRCHNCESTFHAVVTLHKHQENHNGACGKKMACEDCGKVFIGPRALEIHKKSIKNCQYENNMAEKNSDCQHCGKTFTFQTKAKRHMDMYKGACALIFGCEECGKVCIGLPSLKRHKRKNPKCQKQEEI